MFLTDNPFINDLSGLGSEEHAVIGMSKPCYGQLSMFSQ